MSSTHSYLHNPLHHRDTTSDIAHTLYSCPRTDSDFIIRMLYKDKY